MRPLCQRRLKIPPFADPKFRSLVKTSSNYIQTYPVDEETYQVVLG